MASKKKTTAKGPTTTAADTTAVRQRQLQAQIDRKDARGKNKPTKQATQAGTRKQPVRMPAQHLPKPGTEADLMLAPAFEAPDYRGSGKLEGMTAVITGADSGIGRAVAVLFAREGADVAVLYLNEHKDARKPRSGSKRKVEPRC